MFISTVKLILPLAWYIKISKSTLIRDRANLPKSCLTLAGICLFCSVNMAGMELEKVYCVAHLLTQIISTLDWETLEAHHYMAH